MIKLATIFSGIGSPEMSLKQLNIKYNTLFACDIDKFVKQSYLANHECNKWYDDVKSINGLDYTNKVDLFVGGSPCQSFSNAGKRLGLNDDRGRLIYEFSRLVDEIKPKVFIFENVKTLLSKDNTDVFNDFKSRLEKSGYSLFYQVLNAKDYGIPQNRERVFLVGFKDKRTGFKFPEKKELQITVKDLLLKEIDYKYRYKNNSKISKEFKKSKLKNCNTVYQWRRKYIRENKNKLCPTLTANMGTGGHNVPIVIENGGGIRKLTPRECLRLMGFSDDFKIVVSDSQMYKQAGNSIVVNVITELMKSIWDIK